MHVATHEIVIKIKNVFMRIDYNISLALTGVFFNYHTVFISENYIKLMLKNL